MHNEDQENEKRYRCRHIFTDGRRCGSPCLRQEPFCYYHHTTRKPVAQPHARRGRRASFHLPLPEDHSAIQASLGMILQRLAANDLDPRRAGLLLYTLSIASSTLPKPQKPAQPDLVEEITTHPDLGILAPETEFNPPEQSRSLAGRLLAELRKKPTCNCNHPKPTPTILPTLNAQAEPEVLPRSDLKSRPNPHPSKTLHTFTGVHPQVSSARCRRLQRRVTSTQSRAGSLACNSNERSLRIPCPLIETAKQPDASAAFGRSVLSRHFFSPPW